MIRQSHVLLSTAGGQSGDVSPRGFQGFFIAIFVGESTVMIGDLSLFLTACKSERERLSGLPQ